MDIMIQDIILPKEIAEQMANKTLVRSKQEYEVMEQTFEMQAIRLKNEQDKLVLSNSETQATSKVQGAKDIQATQSSLKERKAERDKALNEFLQASALAWVDAS